MDIFEAIWCAIIKLINLFTKYILDSMLSTLVWALSFLPTIPILAKPVDWGVFGDSVGYFLPIADMIVHFGLMLALVVMWYSVQHVMRLIRMIK